MAAKISRYTVIHIREGDNTMMARSCVFLTAYMTFELPGEAGQGLVHYHSNKLQGGLNHDVMWAWFQQLWQCVTNQWQQFPSELLLAFTVTWWTKVGICPTTTLLLRGHLRCCLLCHSYKLEE